MKKAVMIIGQDKFRDEEFFVPKKIMEAAGISVVTAAASLKIALGKMGGSYLPEMKLSDINVRDFDALVFIGGPGAKVYFDDQVAHKLAKDTLAQHKVLAAICCAPVILANAGILNGKKATVFVSDVPAICDKGAVYLDKEVVVDGNLITANGVEAAEAFGQAIVKALK